MDDPILYDFCLILFWNLSIIWLCLSFIGNDNFTSPLSLNVSSIATLDKVSKQI